MMHAKKIRMRIRKILFNFCNGKGGEKKVNEQGKVDIVPILLVAIVVGGGAFLLAGGQLPFQVTQPGDVQPLDIVCTADVTPEIIITASDEINAGTTYTDLNAVTSLNGAFAGIQTLSTDNSIDASAGNSYVIYLINDTATHDYYPQVLSGNVDCAERTLVASKIKLGGAITTSIFNDDDTTTNTIGAPQAIGTGENVSFRIRIRQTTNDAFFGGGYSEKGIGFILDYNKNATDTVEVIGLSTKSGNPVNPVLIGTPGGHTSQDTTNALGTKTYDTGVSQLKDAGDFFEVAVNFTASNVQNPGTDSNMFIRIVDPVLYQNNSGEWKVDYFDEDSLADLGETNGTDTIHVS